MRSRLPAPIRAVISAAAAVDGAFNWYVQVRGDGDIWSVSPRRRLIALRDPDQDAAIAAVATAMAIRNSSPYHRLNYVPGPVYVAWTRAYDALLSELTARGYP